LQKEYQEKLQFQKEEFETIFNYSNDSIIIIDLNKNFLKFNKAFEDFTGYSKEELLTKNCDDLTIPKDREKNDIAIKRAIEIGHVENIEKSCIFKNGLNVSVNMSATLLPDKKSILLSLKDMTSLIVMEQQSKLASMGEMIGNIAHQWRQPLSIITTSMSGLKLKSDISGIDETDINKCEVNIIKQANYLSTTIDNFRNFLKNERIITQLDILKVIENTLSIVGASLDNNYINLILDLKDDLTVDGNKNELTEALINIINNSKDILKNDVKVESDKLIFISTKQIDENSLQLKILDSGGGIKDSNITRIFEPYFTTKHQYHGTGLGLSIAHKIIVDRHHAKMTVNNEKFEYKNKTYTGACFKILFNK